MHMVWWSCAQAATITTASSVTGASARGGFWRVLADAATGKDGVLLLRAIMCFFGGQAILHEAVC